MQPSVATVVAQHQAGAVKSERTGAQAVPTLTSISIKATVQPQQAAPVSSIVADVKPLTEEDLTAYWQEAGEKLGLQELMAEGKPMLGEHTGFIDIEALSVTFHEDFKSHKIDVMEFLRKKTGMKTLDCKVQQLFVKKDDVLYSPDDKYAALLESNPAMAELRKLFPALDY